jgi:hypothetical protein
VDPGPFLYIYYFLLQAPFTFHNYYLLTTNKYHLPHDTFNPCYQQTGEIDNLTASWGKVSWLCCVQFHVAAGADTTPSKASFGVVAKVS